MSLRVQKSWGQIGSPATAGPHEVPGLGTITNLTQEHLDQAATLNGQAQLVLAHLDSDGFEPEWEIVELRRAE